MVQAQTFGSLIYDEGEHGWALEVGLFLGGWITSYGSSRSIDRTLIPRYRDYALMCKSAMTTRLQAHLINIDIPDYDESSDTATPTTVETIVERIKVTCSPVHCAFALIGEAGSFFEWHAHLNDHNDVLEMERRSIFAIDRLRQKCHTLFPDGVPTEAIFERLRRTRGSPSEIRHLLQNFRKPMVILLVLADPLDGSRLCLLSEQQRLKDSLSRSLHRDSFEIQALAEARLDNFGPMLARTKPTIIHFSGHGSQNGIYFSSPTDQAIRIEPSRLSQMLSLAGQDNLQGVVMNACFTEEMFRARALDQDAVVMEGELSDDAAISFAQQFYAYLGDGRSFKDAFIWAQASTDLTGIDGLRSAFIESGTA